MMSTKTTILLPTSVLANPNSNTSKDTTEKKDVRTAKNISASSSSVESSSLRPSIVGSRKKGHRKIMAIRKNIVSTSNLNSTVNSTTFTASTALSSVCNIERKDHQSSNTFGLSSGLGEVVPAAVSEENNSRNGEDIFPYHQKVFKHKKKKKKKKIFYSQ